MHVLHVLASVSPSWGGPPAAVLELSTALAEREVDSTVLGLTNQPVNDLPLSDRVECLPAGKPLWRMLGVPADLAYFSILRREMQRADLVHLHEIWHIPQVAGGLLAAKFGCKYVISPHGALSREDLSKHRYLKRLAWRAYQEKIVNRAAGVHVLTETEAVEARLAGVKTLIACIPNGIDIETTQRRIERARNAGTETGAIEEPYLLYLGRLDRKKGLDLLLRGFSIVAARNSDLNLVIAGPDPLGMWRTILETARKMGIEQRVMYRGFVDTDSKFRLMAKAEAFVLPSRYEGMSMALLEALACGIPVVASSYCNLPEIETFKAGRVVSLDAEPLAQALLEIAQDRRLQASMRSSAVRLVKERFSAKSCADRMLNFYEEVLKFDQYDPLRVTT